jgi:hypothetical protein
MPEFHSQVLSLAEFLSATPNYTDDSISEHLKSEGLSDKAIAVLKMRVQHAWGQQVVAHTGAKSWDEFVFANAAGEILRRGSFLKDPYFIGALELYARCSSYEGCIRFARESAQYNVVQRSIAEGKNVATSTPHPQIMLVDE